MKDVIKSLMKNGQINKIIATVEEGSEPEIRQEIKESDWSVSGSTQTSSGVELQISKHD